MKKIIILTICLIFGFVGSSFGATLSIVTPDDDLEMTGKATIEVRLDGLTDTEKSYMGSSGAAFTIEYGANLVYVPDTLSSSFFDTFQAQFSAAGTDPNPYTGPVNGIYESPVVINNDDDAGKTMVAAARCTATSASSDYVLFTFKVQLSDTSAEKAGDYNITIKPTILNNTDAGYSADGEPIDVVVGSNPNKQPTEEGAYPVIIAKDMAEVSGKVTYASEDIGGPNDDYDNDGLTNAEEEAKGTDPKNPDSDGDGKKDGPEVENGCDPLVDDPQCTIKVNPCEGILKGDLNGDNDISPGDAVDAFNLSLVPSSSWTAEDFCKADFNEDNDISPGDAVDIFYKSLE